MPLNVPPDDAEAPNAGDAATGTVAVTVVWTGCAAGAGARNASDAAAGAGADTEVCAGSVADCGGK